MRIDQIVLPASALLFVLTCSAGLAQVPPILPTDVTGPWAGGGGAQTLLNNLGGGVNTSSAFPTGYPYSDQMFNRLLVSPPQTNEVLTYPAIVSPQYGEPTVLPAAPMWINLPLNPPPSPVLTNPLLIRQ